MAKSIGKKYLKLQDKIIIVLGEGPLFSFCVKELLKKFKNIYCLTNINNKLKYTKKINFTKIKNKLFVSYQLEKIWLLNLKKNIYCLILK